MRSNGHGKPIVAMDIDGTMADYHDWFLWFAGIYLDREMPHKRDINPGRPLHQHMGISKALYREVKMAYRQGGMKRSMPVLPGSQELAEHVRRPRTWQGRLGRGLGCELWVCTTRPYLRLDNIDPDTREWLRRNDIKYDALLFDPLGGDNKYRELVRQAGSRVVAAVEDLPDQAVRAVRAGVPYVLLRDQPYNQHWEGYPGMPGLSVGRWYTDSHLQGVAYDKLAGALDRWKRQRQQQLVR